MNAKNWSVGDVISLIEKGTGLIIEIVKATQEPEVTLKHITDRTQELREHRRRLNQKLEDKFKDEG